MRNAFASSPWLMSLTVVLFPSVQTVLVARVTDLAARGQTGTAMWWAVLAGVAVAGYLAIQQILGEFQRMIQYAINVRCATAINTTMAGLDPQQINDERVSKQARQAREAVDESKVAGQSVSLLSTLFALMVSVSLLVVIWSTSVVAALLVVLSLIPQTVSMIVFSSFDVRGWAEQMDAHRHAAYREDQLRYERPARELAVYDAGGVMAGWANTWRARLGRLQIHLEWLSIRFDALAGLVSSLLIIGALVSLITAGAGAGQLAGSMVGILSGIVATNGVGYMVGTLMSSSVAVQSYLDFTALKPRTSREPAPVSGTAGTTTPYTRPARDGRDAKRPDVAGLDVERLDVGNLSVAYAHSDRPTVHGVSFRAKRGEMIALVGANGAGKTTTIQGLIGMLETPEGRIMLNGSDHHSEPFQARHRYFGLLTQDYGRYELTVRDNLLIGAGGEHVDDEAIAKALERSHADEIVARLPHGLDTQLGEQWNGVGLSGGEWQRIALTRLFLRNAPIWILDEPTSNIDAETEARIFHDLREHSNDHITLVVSHRAWTLRGMDRIYVMDHGTIVEHGDYAELNRPGTRFHELFAFQNEDDSTIAKQERG
ncbi:ATP-binding cassette domain-containing protein [Bifidobacterium mongoliense]|uniref:ATP-binding cassette domain-containing protein n=2 Tax=Bifidobacterium mongoliense TaxID=518643 RepID=UPI0026486C0E|nr:ABC transporter ATP-binding protein [Bifidobacterium mongoliense]MDN5633616.1 ABC transporter ATP-binding protein/permease [Bifidobacterium mongoliense]